MGARLVSSGQDLDRSVVERTGQDRMGDYGVCRANYPAVHLLHAAEGAGH